jgi:hypothetical protein
VGSSEPIACIACSICGESIVALKPESGTPARDSPSAPRSNGEYLWQLAEDND